MSYFFSIVIPVYNTEQYLPRALDSILKQNFDTNKIEVVVVNDNSPKATQCDKIIRRYSSKLKIEYIKNNVNQGTHIARKLGVENCNIRDGYILFLDSDDYLTKNTCKVLYEDIQKNGDVDYIEFNYYSLWGIFKEYSSLNVVYENEVVKNVLSAKKNNTIWNKCYKISFVKGIYANMSSFYSYYNEDYYQMGIIEFYAKKRRFIKNPLYIYVREIGVTVLKKYEKEKLKKMLLSIYNVEINLIDFYKVNNAASYIPLVHSYSEKLYGNAILCSDVMNFIEIAGEILDNERIKNAFVDAVSKYEKRITFLEKRVKLLLPIKIVIAPFIFVYRFLRNMKRV